MACRAWPKAAPEVIRTAAASTANRIFIYPPGLRMVKVSFGVVWPGTRSPPGPYGPHGKLRL